MANQCNNESKWIFKHPFLWEELKHVLETLGFEIFNADYNDISTAEPDMPDYWLELSFGSSWKIPVKELQEIADYFDADVKCVGWEYGNNYFGHAFVVSRASDKINIGKILNKRQAEAMEQMIETINPEEEHVDAVLRIENEVIEAEQKFLEGNFKPSPIPPAPWIPLSVVPILPSHDDVMENMQKHFQEKDLMLVKTSGFEGIYEVPEAMKSLIKEVNERPFIPVLQIGQPDEYSIHKELRKTNGDNEVIQDRIKQLRVQLSNVKKLPKAQRGEQAKEIEGMINRLKGWLK